MPLKKLFACGAAYSRKERERAFLENGGLVLEALVASCNGRPIPIRTFSYKEIISATNNFAKRSADHEFYEGSFKGRSVSIKSYGYGDFERIRMLPHQIKDQVLTNLAISAKMSAHKNVLKPVGCCLETPIPALVFEYAQNQLLLDRIYVTEERGSPMLWQDRLKIARQIAHALAYLHTAFSRPIIHRDIKTSNILIDQHGVPKLSGFQFSLTIPEGETHVETPGLEGTCGFIAPENFLNRMLTEKADVYGFGRVLLEFLTGRRVGGGFPKAESPTSDYMCLEEYLRHHSLNEIVDPAILAEARAGGGMQPQLEAVLQLALVCAELDPEIRPTMVDVTKELRRIERLIA